MSQRAITESLTKTERIVLAFLLGLDQCGLSGATVGRYTMGAGAEIAGVTAQHMAEKGLIHVEVTLTDEGRAAANAEHVKPYINPYWGGEAATND
jgi:hypothetical protein